MALTLTLFGDAAGLYSESGGVHTLNAYGGDTYGGSENHAFASVSITGDFDVCARLVSKSGGGPYGKFGLMVREGLAAGGRLYAAMIEETSTWQKQARTATGGDVGNDGFGGGAPAVYLRITRVGNVLTIHTGSNGTSWSAGIRATTYGALASAVNVGLYAVNQSGGGPVVATFDGLAGFPAGGVEAAGALTLPVAALAGTAETRAEGAGSLALVGSVLAGSGETTGEAVGALVGNGAALAGTATWGVDATGALVSGVGVLAGLGVSTATGSGAFGLVRAVISGVLVAPVGAVTARRLVVVGAGARVGVVGARVRVVNVGVDA